MLSRISPKGYPRRASAAAIFVGVFVLLAGCNVVGPAYMLIAGPGEVEAAYKLDPKRKTVIFVDDPANKIAQRRIRSQIGSIAQDVLLEKKLVLEGNMIDTRAALAAATQGRGDEPIAVTEIGEAVGAEIVVYVLVTRFGLSGDGVDFAPSSEIEVKIFDATTHSRLWPPAGQPGHRAQFADTGGNRTMPRTRTDSLRAQSDLAQLTGYGLAQMFYDVERPQSLRR